MDMVILSLCNPLLRMCAIFNNYFLYSCNRLYNSNYSVKMNDQENLMDELTTFLEIFKDLTGDFDIANLNSVVDLTCGCRKPVYLIMIELGCQVKYCEAPICREHDWEHQFSYNHTMKDICVQFFDLNLKNPNSPYHFTLHPRV